MVIGAARTEHPFFLLSQFKLLLLSNPGHAASLLPVLTDAHDSYPCLSSQTSGKSAYTVQLQCDGIPVVQQQSPQQAQTFCSIQTGPRTVPEAFPNRFPWRPLPARARCVAPIPQR